MFSGCQNFDDYAEVFQAQLNAAIALHHSVLIYVGAKDCRITLYNLFILNKGTGRIRRKQEISFYSIQPVKSFELLLDSTEVI